MKIGHDFSVNHCREYSEKCLFINISMPHGNSSFIINSYYNKDLNHFDFIFPESNIGSKAKELYQSQIDICNYEDNVRNLTEVERLSIRGWSALGDEIGEDDYSTYTDGSPVVTFGSNYELNKKLAQGEMLDTNELLTVNSIKSGLEKLPAISGEFVRIAEHSDEFPSPWGHKVGVNDIVSCSPCFMSASLSLDYSACTMKYNKFLFPEKTNAIVIYKIICHEGCSSAVPLLKGILSPPDLNTENEVLFNQGSCFRVDGIISADPVNDSESSLKRIGVILTQIHPQTCNAKNIFTGE